MWNRVARCGRLIGALLALTAAAAAQQTEGARAEPAPGSLEAVFREADRRFVAGDLQGALAVLQPACAGTDSAECAFSLGAIQHGLGHCPEALGHYRRYLQLAPHGEHQPDVSAALEEVESRCGGAPSGPPAPSPAVPSPAVPSPAVPVASVAASPALPPAPPAAVEPSALGRRLTTAAFVVSGAAAASSVVFGLLAARSARRCERADAYDRSFIDECEVKGPRYQGLWQGSAVASGAFLGVGVALWWSASRVVSASVSDTGLPGLALHGRF